MALTGAAWVPQDVDEFPQMWWTGKVGADHYLAAGQDGDSMSTIVKVYDNDGWMTEMSTNAGSVNPKSMAVAGLKIITGGANTGLEEAWFDVFSTAHGNSIANVSVATPGINSPKFGAGALAGDGFVYFPPSRLSASLLPAKFDPVAHTVSLTNFGGQWSNAASQVYGIAVLGGDGHLYFLPGFSTIGGGGGGSGTDVLRINPTTPTVVSTLTPVHPYSGSSREDAFYSAFPAPDGIYALSTKNGIYKVTSAGWTRLAIADPWASGYTNGDELSNTMDVGASMAQGSDGLIYCVGSTYRASGSYSPAVFTIDPATDEVHFQEFPSMTGVPFIPTATYAWGERIGAFSRTFGDEFPDLFEATIDGGDPPAEGTPFSLGATPIVGISLGATPIDIS